jgi:hypothetical protein
MSGPEPRRAPGRLRDGEPAEDTDSRVGMTHGRRRVVRTDVEGGQRRGPERRRRGVGRRGPPYLGGEERRRLVERAAPLLAVTAAHSVRATIGQPRSALSAIRPPIVSGLRRRRRPRPEAVAANR